MAINVVVFVAGKVEIDKPNVLVLESGNVELPLLRRVHVAGLTLEGATKLLTKAYSKYYVDPEVSVFFSRIAKVNEDVSPWGSVTVMGQVKKPGRFQIPAAQDLTVSAAILAAGGFDVSAKDSTVWIIRETPSGEKTRIEVNVRAIFSGRRDAEDVVLRPNDLVFVPESLF